MSEALLFRREPLDLGDLRGRVRVSQVGVAELDRGRLHRDAGVNGGRAGHHDAFANNLHAAPGDSPGGSNGMSENCVEERFHRILVFTFTWFDFQATWCHLVALLYDTTR